jgi:hypothetical protein
MKRPACATAIPILTFSIIAALLRYMANAEALILWLIMTILASSWPVIKSR